ncbi:nucleoside-diphosphate-sugar epimerase [bacterium]|nr:MAG: nucleoside-diphosphate-sugar epimerase [bacterium]
MKILVTGGAGFIGSHLVDALVERGHDVVVYDSLEYQVHEGRVPDYLNPGATLIVGDIRDRDKLKKVIVDESIEIIFHEASLVGVGQSMYEIERYVAANTWGTAVLLDILATEKHKVKKIIVASSMSIYGEGAYRCKNCGDVYPKMRKREQMEKREWEMRCPVCGEVVEPIPTSEEKPLHPTSIYAISKKDQEEMVLVFGEAYGIPAVALRYFNVYGTRQALSNPYTGVIAIFSSRLLNGKPPVIFEDGNQSRDFIHVKDIVKANLLAMEKDEANGEVFNVGTGRRITIMEVAETLIKELGMDIEPLIEGRFRAGDIRHCYADISKIKEKLGFVPEVPLEKGIREILPWIRSSMPEDRFERAKKELEEKGLIV